VNSANPWHGAGPELIIAAITVGLAGLAGGAVAGWAGAATALIAAATLAMVVLRGLAPHSAAQSVRRTKDKQVARAITGYAQRRSIVASSLSSRTFYEADLRPVLEHLLAARLAEKHGINLYQDPAAARAAFCRGRADESLWSWIDPAQALQPENRDLLRYGIPRRTLARLINRLEQF
jgi:F0F1-type ATP synthase membrane subunit c/vacuolar-type H+-ATPase subunit K